MRKTVLAWGLAAAVVVACTPDTPEPRAAHRIVVGSAHTAGDLDPVTCHSPLCALLVAPNTHEGLVGLGSDLQPVEALAASWSVGEDALTYTFELREDVVFHDGSAFTAEVMAASLERARRLSGATAAGTLLFDTVHHPPRSGIVEVQATEPHRLVIRLAEPDAAFLTKLALPLAAAVPASYPADTTASQDHVVGTGPYRLVEDGFREGGRIDLERHDAYWGDPAATEEIRIELIGQPEDLRAAIRDHRVDLAVGMSADDTELLRDEPGVRVVTEPGSAVRFLGLNVTREPLTSPHVRRAIAAALNREELVAEAVGEAGFTLYGMVPQGVPGHTEPFRDPGTVDAHLEAAGIGPDERVRVELWYTPSRYGAGEEQVALAVQNQLQDTGRFDVMVGSSPWADYTAALSRGEMGAFLLGWFPDYPDPENYLVPFAGSAGARRTGTRYSSPRVDELIVAQRAARSWQDRAAGLEALQAELASDVPLVPLWQTRQVVVAADGLEGLQLHAGERVMLGSLRLTVEG